MTVFTGAALTDVAGYIGNYSVAVLLKGEERTIECGAIVVTTGAHPLQPEGVFGYNGKRVISLIELERKLASGRLRGSSFVFITCAGARNSERQYCSKICCMVAVKDALHIRETVPDSTVYILYRDLMCYGLENEELLRRAKEAGVRFVSYSKDEPPTVKKGVVNVTGDVMGRDFEIPCDTVVLATPLIRY